LPKQAEEDNVLEFNDDEDDEDDEEGELCKI